MQKKSQYALHRHLLDLDCALRALPNSLTYVLDLSPAALPTQAAVSSIAPPPCCVIN